MGPISWFLFVYVLGGLSFLPLVIGLILLHAHLTFPTTGSPAVATDDPAEIKRSTDDQFSLNSATDSLAAQFHRKHESDVAAGYFAVCREYVPGGVNGKPPERSTPAGEVVVPESPSVYQSMYRSIFDRQQKPTIEPNKANGRAVKKANNVFFVVLRHGHLMLYDDAEQLEVRHVISLEYHNVSLYAGGEEIPEGELWIKRNAICLRRKPLPHLERSTSLPFYLFSENQSEKEDFYFALLKNQEKIPGSDEAPPLPQEYNVKHIITLVQRLHSSEEQLQTRWLNALLGRFFLAMYKTPELEGFIRKKMTKKISRVKKPNFITKLALQKIDMGDGAPFVTNPRLKDLTVNGDCVAEADLKYSGNFRIEVAATARIDLGARFKAREVEMVLAVVIKKMEGHGLIRFKPPPSNRLWMTFETMPKIDMAIEPIVSSRQITYNLILRAIESRIREVVAETIVLPNWDDIAFLDTTKEKFRGGIWKKAPVVAKPVEIPNEDPEDEAEAGGDNTDIADVLKSGDERTISTPALPPSPRSSLKSRLGNKSVSSLAETATGLPIAVERTARPEPPRALRSSSIASAADPMLTTNHADGVRRATDTLHGRDVASAMLKDISNKSVTASPTESPAGSPPNESQAAAAFIQRGSSTSSKASTESLSALHRRHPSTSSISQSADHSSIPPTPTTVSLDSRAPSIFDEEKRTNTTSSAAPSTASSDKRKSLAAIASATAAAKDWGWGVLARNKQKAEIQDPHNKPGTPNFPMGRGYPLPPPGTPLPLPERLSKKSIPQVPKRRPVPPPLLPKRPSEIVDNGAGSSFKPRLPERRDRQDQAQGSAEEPDEVLVVEAPMESAPATPTVDEHHDDFFGHGEAPGEAETAGEQQLGQRFEMSKTLSQIDSHESSGSA